MSLTERVAARRAGLPPPCVETDNQTQTITVYVSDEELWVFPWARFGGASLKGDELTMRFGDREIVARGMNLAGVFGKLAGLRIEILRTVDAHFRPLLDGNEPFVTEIEIRPVDL